ncbi:hypothetical protein ABE65_011835 [Fictibacillus phosphorivorans]|uniref:Uncharacterized protein n=1 Tax=Fictibacillus phosphorivorans TaxID=1221500 RepID=A0A160INJ3_9BACL|nr:hypothetical protein [Fictibacillus phosphorivorans]ANC77450.1 hypothetical protein ABE65_011835 [Fictibacillus phosphorivorans]
MKKRISKGEQDFVRGCTRAILERDVSHVHWLIVQKGVRHYIHHQNELEIEDYIHRNRLKLICVVSREFINDWHIRYSGNDLSKGLIKKRLNGMIRASEKVADLAYGDFKKEDIEELLSQVPTEGLTTEERTSYLARVRSLLESK